MKSSTYPKQYRTSSYWLLLPLWILACLTVGWSWIRLGTLAVRMPGFWLFIAFMAPLQISILVLFFHIIHDVRLRITDDGIEFSTWSRTVYVQWQQVKRIDYAYFQRQLVIEKPIVEQHKAWWLWLDFQKLVSFDNFRYVPFSRWAWENFNEVETEIMNRLPHIFETSK